MVWRNGELCLRVLNVGEWQAIMKIKMAAGGAGV